MAEDAKETCIVHEGGKRCREPVAHQESVFVPEHEDARVVGVCEKHWRSLHTGMPTDLSFTEPKKGK